MLLFLTEEVGAALELLLTVDDQLAAEDGEGVREVSHHVDDTRPTGQCLYLCAAVAHLGEQLLHEAELYSQV